MLRRSFLTFCSASALVSAVSTVTAAPLTEIDFGIISTESSQNLRPIWTPFLKRMEEETGLKVNAFFASDYAGIITGMQYGKVQVAWFGNKSAIEAVDRAEGEIFAQTMDEAGIGGYYSHLIVHKDSPLTSEKDVLKTAATLTFGNGDPNSTSGFLVPGYYVFAMNKGDPKKIFKRTLNANHEANALAVASKQIDVATNNSENLARLEVTDPAKRAEIRVIWTSPLIPSDPLVWRKDLPDETKKKLSSFFFNFGVNGKTIESDKAILKALAWAPFKPATNEHSLPIRQLELFKTRLKIENDDKMDAAEKSKKLKEMDNELERLNARLEAVKKG